MRRDLAQDIERVELQILRLLAVRDELLELAADAQDQPDEGAEFGAVTIERGPFSPASTTWIRTQALYQPLARARVRRNRRTARNPEQAPRPGRRPRVHRVNAGRRPED